MATKASVEEVEVKLSDFCTFIEQLYEAADGDNFMPTVQKPSFMHEYLDINYVIPTPRVQPKFPVDRNNVRYRMNLADPFKRFIFVADNVYMHGIGDGPVTDKETVEEYTKHFESVYGNKYTPMSEAGDKSSYSTRITVKELIKDGTNVVNTSQFVRVAKLMVKALSDEYKTRVEAGTDFIKHIQANKKTFTTWEQVEAEYEALFKVKLKPMYLYVDKTHVSKFKDIPSPKFYTQSVKSTFQSSTYQDDYSSKTPESVKTKNGPFIPAAYIKVPFWGATSNGTNQYFKPYELRMCRALAPNHETRKLVDYKIGADTLNAKNAWKVLNSKNKLLRVKFTFDEINISGMGVTFPCTAIELIIIPSDRIKSIMREPVIDRTCTDYFDKKLAESLEAKAVAEPASASAMSELGDDYTVTAYEHPDI
jgi:hypothetical protein